MKVVIDSNRAIAALIKDSTTREILFNRNFEFVAPSHITTEIISYKNAIIQKINIAENEFDILLSLIFQHIKIIPQKEYDEFIAKLKDEIKDPKDVPYIAACIAAKAEGIWTHDPHFMHQKRVKVFTNIDMLKLCENASSNKK